MSFEPRLVWTEDEKSKGKVTKWSNFWILINSNMAGANEFEESHLVTVMRRAVSRVFGDKKHIIHFLDVLGEDGEALTRGKMKGIDTIESVDTEGVVEVGPLVHRIHAHLLLMITHKTRLRVNIPRLRDLIRNASKENGAEEPLFKNPIIRLKVIKQDPIAAVRKYQRGYKTKIPVSLIDKINQNDT